jgi:hypothetical protein
MVFKKQDGRATSRNAIRLLKLLGYSEDIIRAAENRASHFMIQGSWEGMSN